MKKWVLGLCSLLIVTYSSAVEIAVGEGRVAAKPIAIVPFAGSTGDESVDFIVAADLKQSGVFAPIAPTAYQARPSQANQVDYGLFQGVGAAYVVVGELSGGSIRFALLDAFQQNIVGSYVVNVPRGNLRHGAHQVSDIILEKLTGVRGAFATRIAYIHESGLRESRAYHLMMADMDGYNSVTLLTSRAPIMSPRFSPDAKQLAYVTFEGQQQQIVTHDIATGRRGLVSNAPGINSAPAWSPDGTKIAFVLSKDGNPEIYFKKLATNRLVRVTDNPAIETEPVWSPDGQSIYFTSNRGGSPQLYRINIGTGALSRITGTGSYSAGADVSSDGSKIALARNNGGRFVVGTMGVNGGAFAGVSQGFIDETPRFSPNGQMLIFTSVENNRSVLKIVNVDGSGTNTLSSSGQIRDPDWSTYIQ
ncbi:Tol-Pal system beta propeller repeat protein TolB [Ostreibacterium oceani]|nr:Tol-Pal system beta propeller repeat protein TolB [Ostreibacterium oceani]